MKPSVKRFEPGKGWAFRLRKAAGLDADQVWMMRKEATGGMTLQPNLHTVALNGLIKLLAAAPPRSAEFIPARNDAAAADPFADWPA